MRTPSFIYAAMALVAISGCSGAPPSGVQNPADFNEAIDNRGTANPIVKITIDDGKSQKTSCVFASQLLAAIAIEHGRPTNDPGVQTLEFAKKAPNHQFLFRNPVALDQLRPLPWLDEKRSRLACQIIDSGRPAMVGDYAPYLYAGNGKGGMEIVAEGPGTYATEPSPGSGR